MADLINNQRRAVLGAMLVAAGISVVPQQVWAAVKATPESPLLNTLCDITLPDTDTPGARKAGVPAFVITAIEHGLANCPATALADFKKALALLAGKDFLALNPQQQLSLLTTIDDAAFSRTPVNHLGDAPMLWKAIKTLIVTGYYTSEVGGSQELRYVLVPGRFDADVPCDNTTRAFSSDWTGVKFG
ncbi:gluconate 2-dehydrogenase subunit 3 family protein [Alteromonas sp. AMM-1]|uniref:gluconate 2-dehydrogenase subunit 3 family protein n=1 Tax=Alteromonas sp. AMM-1 TaxID=3394233 RepID=UPI0039A4C38D